MIRQFLMSLFVLIQMITFIQGVFAAESVTTKYGKLTVMKDSESNPELLCNGKIIMKGEGGYISIGQVFEMKDSAVVLIESNMGGSGTVSGYSFLTLKSNSKPTTTDEFFSWLGEIQPKQKGDEIIVDLGYNEKKHEILTYKGGKISIKKLSTKGKQKTANEDDCNYLYNSIYTEYVKAQNCEAEPEEVGGMSTARPYYAFNNDPRFNLKTFQNLARSSCKKWDIIKYSAFKKQVCSGSR